MRAAFDRVLTSGRYIMGPEVDGLEAEVAEFTGAAHAIGVSSGTDALLCSLMALGIGRGDEVICPTYTFFATAGTIWRTGAKPVFVDVDPATYNTDAERIAAAITERTRVIMPVHLFGQCCDMGPIVELASQKGIRVIEDAAQAIGAKCGDRGAGSMGDFGCFSFFPSKNLGCLGDGGIITTNDADLAEEARIMRIHGGKPKYHHKVVGGNFRLDPLQAAMVRVRLPRLPAETERRRANAARYEELFHAAGIVSGDPVDVPSDKIGLPVKVQPSHIYNQFVIRVGGGRREALRAALGQHGIGNEVYYPIPMHLQECFAELGHSRGDFPVAERAAEETLALPIFASLTDDELQY
ncbi:MAG: DegT/DnrJ/EryC1/StrS family aminotransferase, partial [Planctomycetes bacterium]|nr:DegT/DnrJ/EryC1/StrS family aminotransferase [Planctomycetota bacterium]